VVEVNARVIILTHWTSTKRSFRPWTIFKFDLKLLFNVPRRTASMSRSSKHGVLIVEYGAQILV